MIIADTGFWLALANRSDRHHAAATAALKRIRSRLITTWPVMTETCHLLCNRLGHKPQLRFIDSFAHGAFDVFDLTPVRSSRHNSTL